ncbi:unnamed protein product [Protopolystoma xenopodis]|uniref:Uncharacterized protein n=1 Tax=Protopolystoma xenopodis TaxID=117903 RepID=A0A448WSP3_9PLAT|nr:unnamed protein product [Protopolystoma xenopodis]
MIVFVWGFGRIGLGPLVEYAPRPTMIPPYLFPTALPTYSADSNLIHSDSSSKSSLSHSDQKDSSSHKLVGLYAGLHHFVARSSHGLLWSWGAPRGCLSCLGLGDSIRSTSRSSSGSVSIIGQTYPAQIALPAEALDVSCGVDHTFVLASSFI